MKLGSFHRMRKAEDEANLLSARRRDVNKKLTRKLKASPSPGGIDMENDFRRSFRSQSPGPRSSHSPQRILQTPDSPFRNSTTSNIDAAAFRFLIIQLLLSIDSFPPNSSQAMKSILGLMDHSEHQEFHGGMAFSTPNFDSSPPRKLLNQSRDLTGAGLMQSRDFSSSGLMQSRDLTSTGLNQSRDLTVHQPFLRTMSASIERPHSADTTQLNKSTAQLIYSSHFSGLQVYQSFHPLLYFELFFSHLVQLE